MTAHRVTGHVKAVQRQRGPVYYLKYRLPDGRQVQKLLGPKWTERGRPPIGYYTDRTADEALQELLADARRGTLAGADTPTGKTFADACAEWIRYTRDDKQIAVTTLNDYEHIVSGCLLPEFGKITPLEQISTERIEVYRDRLLAEGKLSRRTIQKHLIAIYGVLKRAKRRKWIASNPAEDVERVKIRRSGDFNVLSPAEVYAIARATDEFAGAIFTFAAFTGLRLGELRALRWGHVDFAARTIRVRLNQPSGGDEKTPKSGKVRSVPLIDQAAVALDRLSLRERFTGPDDRVFCGPFGDAFDHDEMRAEFYAALKRAGLGRLRDRDDPIVFHDLRHTFGTLGAAIWPLHDLQGYMGHADIQTTMRYVHHVPKITAADELSRAVAAALGVSPDVSRTAENEATRTDTGAAV